MLNNISNIYFLGICGIGMSALARWTNFKNFNIKGWDDDITSPLLDLLYHEGIEVHNKVDDPDFRLFLQSSQIENTIMIYTSAISKEHPVLNLFNSKKIRSYKRADLLQYISQKYQVVAVAGTHGKTTISIMLSHILKCCNVDCNAFFGGISKNYKTNLMVGDSNIMIIEADEYDKSFLKLNPDISLVSSMDKDHGDIYKTDQDLFDAYSEFISSTKNLVVGHISLNNKFDFTYSLDSSSDFYASDIDYNNTDLWFTIHFPENQSIRTKLNFGSIYNIENSIAAASLAFNLGLSPTSIAAALTSFKGVSRRFDYYCIEKSNSIIIDDYAHHPEELRSLITSVRMIHKQKKIFLIFQPHLFSRTQEFETQFSEVLSLVDKLVLTDIYPARETKIKGVNSENLLKKVDLKYKWHVRGDFNQIEFNQFFEKILLENKPDLVVTAGAGSIYNLIPKLQQLLA